MEFHNPLRAIFDENDLEEFKRSQSFKDILNFVKACSESVIGIAIPNSSSESNIVISDVVQKCRSFMILLASLIDEIPPLHQPMRYGNKAFRDWHARLILESEDFLCDILPVELKDAKVELAAYLHQSFGNETRIDYGTGHELSLVIFYLCLYKLKVLTEKDFPAIICIGFASYIKLMRKLQEGT